MKKVILGYFILLGVCAFLFFGIRAYYFSTSAFQPLYENKDGISYCAKIDGEEFLLWGSDGKWKNEFFTGVDIGSGKPGFYPGDLAITEKEYFQWFQQIADMNANVIRIYIPQSPDFYEAFYKYNQVAPTPLYLIQGVYINEEEVDKYSNVYADSSGLIDEFDQDIKDAVDMIHGNAVVAQRTGKASGTYKYDVSQYVVGWILGIEWDSSLVIGTNQANPQKTAYNGTYVYTKDASPFEVFLAESADLAISYETRNYQMQRPVAICNWPTTDPLSHPGDPLHDMEDAVSVDAEHICATSSFDPSFFASYHVYPYYPDFMSYETKYQVGGSNSYREYLKELNAYHSMPILISEFGLPTSRGKAHTNQITGLNQGNLTEAQQGYGIISMLQDIHDTGCMGGIVFAWQDEWFKTTWNTMDFDDPSNRPQWFNVQTAEQNFGILKFDSSENVVIDGKSDDWQDVPAVSTTGNEALNIQFDEAYLYMRAKVPDFENGTYVIPIDTLPDSGSDAYETSSFARNAEFVLVLSGKDNTRLLIDPYYNPNYKLYDKDFFTEQDMALYETKNSGVFIEIEQMVSRKLVLPETGEIVPIELFNAGRLRYGIADSNSNAYDSLADFYSADDGNVEIRIPWMLLNVADPSSCEILANLHDTTDFTYQTVEKFYFGIGTADEQDISMAAYQLSGWKIPTYYERLKQSYGILKDNFIQYLTVVPSTSEGLISAVNDQAVRLFYLRFDEKIRGLELVIYLLFIAITILFYFFVILLIVNMLLNRRIKIRRQERERLIMLCKGTKDEALEHINLKYLSSNEGINLLYELLTEGPPEQNKMLQTILLEKDYRSFLKKKIHMRNVQDLNFVIKVAAMLDLTEFIPDIIALMERHRENLDVQYNCFLALSLMGCKDELIQMCKREGYTQILSYRCLKEIFNVYSGDKMELYQELYDLPDPYIKRICVKVIGDEEFTEFEDDLIPLLETNDINLLCDVIRTLGQLKSKKAGERIKVFTDHESWTIRNVAIMALGEIDLQKYLAYLEKGLCDKEWWVRYNSAMKICNYEKIEEVEERIEKTKDHFAKEILTYAIAKSSLQQKEA